MIHLRVENASGGVLFIDEVYSLVDDKDGMFGDEAINTIVQEMENRREDVVVIFAGYPDKMEGKLHFISLKTTLHFTENFIFSEDGPVYQIEDALTKSIR